MVSDLDKTIEREQERQKAGVAEFYALLDSIEAELRSRELDDRLCLHRREGEKDGAIHGPAIAIRVSGTRHDLTTVGPFRGELLSEGNQYDGELRIFVSLLGKRGQYADWRNTFEADEIKPAVDTALEAAYINFSGLDLESLAPWPPNTAKSVELDATQSSTSVSPNQAAPTSKRVNSAQIWTAIAIAIGGFAALYYLS